MIIAPKTPNATLPMLTFSPIFSNFSPVLPIPSNSLYLFILFSRSFFSFSVLILFSFSLNFFSLSASLSASSALILDSLASSSAILLYLCSSSNFFLSVSSSISLLNLAFAPVISRFSVLIGLFNR